MNTCFSVCFEKSLSLLLRNRERSVALCLRAYLKYELPARRYSSPTLSSRPHAADCDAVRINRGREVVALSGPWTQFIFISNKDVARTLNTLTCLTTNCVSSNSLVWSVSRWRMRARETAKFQLISARTYKSRQFCSSLRSCEYDAQDLIRITTCHKNSATE